jgi:hypothetical protein
MNFTMMHGSTNIKFIDVFVICNFEFLSQSFLKFDFYRTDETMGANPMQEKVHFIFMFSAHGLTFDIFVM